MQNEKQNSFDQFLLCELNDAQRRAVKHIETPVLVVAGAGSGKTRVITARIAYLMLHHEAQPLEIVALTFTNKAAHEMKERIGSFLSAGQGVPFVGTFHAYCLQLLKKNQSLLEFPFISIMDADDQEKLIATIIKHHGVYKVMTPKSVAYQISQIKNNLLHTPAVALFADYHPQIQEVYHAYERERKASKLVDFDDLLIETVRLFRHSAFKESYQKTVKHILVDEYQDTNVVQHMLLKEMAMYNGECVAQSVCAVGDEDQSIYSWRGATVANMLNFQKDFKKTTIIKVEQNYRSVQPILSAANALIAHNTERNPKTLWSEKKGTDRIRVIVCNSEYQEADAIGALLTLCATQKKLPSVAILYRTHMQSRALEEACVKRSIPYRIVGGVQFYERKEIKDVLAYLRLLVNPYDRTSFMRVINCPARGLGTAFETMVFEAWQQESLRSYKELLQMLIEQGQIKGVKEVAIKQFMACFDGMSAEEDAPADIIERIICNTLYFSYLKEQYDPQDAETRIANVKELINAARHLEREKNIKTCVQLLDEIALMQDKAAHTNQDHQAVTLMTLHAAKGLEFDMVILAGLEDGILPSTRSLNSAESIEEERRLFYVGMTRARERLLLSYCKYRYTYGQMVDQRASRFIEEIPKNLFVEYDMRHNELYRGAFFAEWLGVSYAVPTVMTFRASPMMAKERGIQKKSMPYASTIVKKESAVSGLKAAIESSTKTQIAVVKNQVVRHKKYGVGLVQKIEPQSDGTVYITATFKIGTKKILDTYLEKV